MDHANMATNLLLSHRTARAIQYHALQWISRPHGLFVRGLKTTPTTRPPFTTDEGLTIFESNPEGTGQQLGLTWGSVLWPSGIALAKYLTYNLSTRKRASSTFDGTDRHNVRLRILELGCGTGVVGLTAAKIMMKQHEHSPQSIFHITLTDSESALWPLVRQSMAANHLDQGDFISIHQLDWRDTSTFLWPPLQSKATHKNSNDHGVFDMVLAADVLYAGMAKLFARALAAHLPNRAELQEWGEWDDKNISSNLQDAMYPYALVAVPHRKDSPLLEFCQVCDRLGLAIQRLETDEGAIAGAFTGTDAVEAFIDTHFVNISSKSLEDDISPSFSSHNTKQIQILRIHRTGKSAAEALSIRRVSRI